MKRLNDLLALSPAKFAIGYLVFGVVWITLSDRVVATMVESEAMVTQLQTLKGWLFVGLSASFIFALASVRERQIDLWRNRLETATEELQVLHRIFRHNISNDMMVIRGYVELVHGELSNGHKEHLEVAIQKSDRIIDMSEKLKVIESTDLETSIETSVDLCRIIEDECADLEWEHAGVSIDLDIPEFAKVRGDNILSYVVREAIENSIHHFDREIWECDIDVSVQKRIDETVVRISDNGPGIPENELIAYRQGDEQQTTHTSGVGLWLIKWLCGICGGAVDIASDEGTVVTLRFQPATPLENVAPAVTTEQVPQTP